MTGETKQLLITVFAVVGFIAIFFVMLNFMDNNNDISYTEECESYGYDGTYQTTRGYGGVYMCYKAGVDDVPVRKLRELEDSK